MKNFIKGVLKSSGYEIKKSVGGPGHHTRPVGEMKYMLEDLSFRGLKCKAIIDVGANSAQWSRQAKSVFRSSAFCLIEPQLEMKGKLEEFCSEFPGSIYFLAGAAAEKGVLTLTVWDDLAGSSFLPQTSDDLKKKGRQREIDMITIDEIVSSGKLQMPELIKLDVQGFELEALKGAESTFGLTEVYIMEVSLIDFDGTPGIPLISDVISFMLERDYVVYDFPGFLRRPLDGALGQCDICFVKKNGFLRASKRWI